MSKSAKLVLLTLVVIVSFIGAILTSLVAYRYPDYPDITKYENTINEVTNEVSKVKVTTVDESKPYINILYILAIHGECLIFGVTLVYLILTNFCEKSSKEAIDQNSMVYCFIVLSLSAMEFVSVIMLLIIKYQLLLQVK